MLQVEIILQETFVPIFEGHVFTISWKNVILDRIKIKISKIIETTNKFTIKCFLS